MADTVRSSDKSIGLALVFGVVTVLATMAMLGTSYAAMLNDDGGMQVLSGISFAVAMLAAGVAVAAVHLFGD